MASELGSRKAVKDGRFWFVVCDSCKREKAYGLDPDSAYRSALMNGFVYYYARGLEWLECPRCSMSTVARTMKRAAVFARAAGLKGSG